MTTFGKVLASLLCAFIVFTLMTLLVVGATKEEAPPPRVVAGSTYPTPSGSGLPVIVAGKYQPSALLCGSGQAYGVSGSAVACLSVATDAGAGTSTPNVNNNGLRLSLTSGTPVTTNDVTGASTIYWTPFQNGTVTLWNGSALETVITGEVSLGLGTLSNNTNYDVFAQSLDGGAPNLLLGAAWNSATARDAGISIQNGLWSLSSDATQRYLGTFRTTATTTTEDSASKRFLYNQNNPVSRQLQRSESTSSWTNGTAAWRQANGSTANTISVLNGQPWGFVSASLNVTESSSGMTGGAVGIGIDSTTTPSGSWVGGGGNLGIGVVGFWNGYPGLGFHAINWLEYGGSGVSFDGNVSGIVNSGLLATVWQ